MRKVILAAAAIALLTGSAVQAATLTASGSVQLNQGQGFKPVSGVVEVRPGDRILVGKGGSAQVAYDGSCARTVAPNAMSTVMAASPCSSLMRQGSGGGNDDNNDMLIIGGLLVAGGVGGAIIAANKSNKSSP